MAILETSTKRLLALDLALCLRIHAAAGAASRRFFGVVSRLGDGWLWLAVTAALPVVHGPGAWPVVFELLVTAGLAMGLYKTLKRGTARPRPCAVAESLQEVTPALDVYSFPSGHTLHAVAFTVVVAGQLGGWAWVLVPFTILVACSRVVLGLHYPTDVVAGAALGAVVGAAGSLVT